MIINGYLNPKGALFPPKGHTISFNPHFQFIHSAILE